MNKETLHRLVVVAIVSLLKVADCVRGAPSHATPPSSRLPGPGVSNSTQLNSTPLDSTPGRTSLEDFLSSTLIDKARFEYTNTHPLQSLVLELTILAGESDTRPEPFLASFQVD